MHERSNLIAVSLVANSLKVCGLTPPGNLVVAEQVGEGLRRNKLGPVLRHLGTGDDNLSNPTHACKHSPARHRTAT
jgi:hypothetical protein